jgi:hypothetical protein
VKDWFSKLQQRAPFTWPFKRKLRWFIALVLMLLLYPVLGTLALWTGFVERSLASEDLKVEIANPAYTIWPGKIRMKHVRILVNGDTQFSLEADDLVVNIRLWQLIHRMVQVTQLSAQGVRYQMRVQVKDPKGMERRIAAYPPLKDLPGTHSITEKTAEKTEKRDPDYTVKVTGLDIKVAELWFFEYRYLGKGRLRGGFTVGPQLMEVASSVQDLGPGELRFGPDQTVAKNFRGQITANIPKVNPEAHADASFMTLVDARVNLKADVQSLVNVGAYFAGVDVTRGAGPLAVDLFLDKGKLGSKSRLDFETESVHVKGDGFGVGTDWKVNFEASGSPEQLPIVRSDSKLTYFSLARGNRAFTLQIQGHHEEATLDTIQLSRATDLKHAAVRMPKIVSTDLRDLPVLLPEDTPVKVEGGDAHASLKLDMDEKYWASGPLSAMLRDLDLDAAGVKLRGNMWLETEARFNPKLQTNMLENMTLTMRNLSMRAGSRSVDDWWMNIQSKKLTLWNSKPPRAEGTLSIRARDLQPVLKALAEKDVISSLIPMFTSLTDFRAKTTIRTAGPVTDVTLESESDIWDASGRIYSNGKQQQMAIVVGGQAVSLGIAKAGDDLEIMPFAKTGWLNDHLRTFPKPLVQLPASKP